MSVYQESGVEFDFSQAQTHERHDATNTIFPGVDFVVQDRGRQLWLEIKSWAPNAISPRRRGGQRRSYLSKMGQFWTKGGSRFADALRGKFLGTCTFETLTGAPPQCPIVYVMLLESGPADAALRSHLMGRMRTVVRRQGVAARPWLHPVEVAVVDVAEWNARFPEYPAIPLP